MDTQAQLSFSGFFLSLLSSAWNFLVYFFKIVANSFFPSSKDNLEVLSISFSPKGDVIEPIMDMNITPDPELQIVNSSDSSSSIGSLNSDSSECSPLPSTSPSTSPLLVDLKINLENSDPVQHDSSEEGSLELDGHDSDQDLHSSSTSSLASSIEISDLNGSQEMDDKKYKRRRRRGKSLKNSQEDSQDNVSNSKNTNSRKQSQSNQKNSTSTSFPSSFSSCSTTRSFRSNSLKEIRAPSFHHDERDSSKNWRSDPPGKDTGPNPQFLMPRRFSHSALIRPRDEDHFIQAIRPIRQPLGPILGNNGFSDEYRRSRSWKIV